MKTKMHITFYKECNMVPLNATLKKLYLIFCEIKMFTYFLRMQHTGNTLTKPQILGGVRASVPRSTIITQGRQAITESCGRYRVHNFSKPVTHKQKHRNRHISAQNVKNVLKFTPITVSLPGNAVLRHNCTQKFHLARNPRIPNVFRTSNLPVSINVICSRGITTSGTRSFPKSWLIR